MHGVRDKLQCQIGLMRSLAADGCSRAEVAAELGWSVAKVAKWAVRYKVRFRHGREPDAHLRSEVFHLIDQGHTNATAIALAMGRPRSLVTRWVKEYEQAGLITRTGGKRFCRLSLTRKWKVG